MAEEAPAPAVPHPTEDSNYSDAALVQDVALEPVSRSAGSKRAREGAGEEEEEEEEEDGESKKQKAETYFEEKKEEEDTMEDELMPEGTKILGPKAFGSSVEMFDYFVKLLHSWPPNLDVNKYERMVLLDLIKKGHSGPDGKIGVGIQAFQVRFHPAWKSRCFFLVRVDGSTDDFSFRKCVDQILPLPDNLKLPYASIGNQRGGGHGGRRGRGGRSSGCGRARR